jgi:hypothetical protein
MNSEYKIQLIEVVITDINLDVSAPYDSDEEYGFAIEMEGTWSLSEDKKMYILFPSYSFEVTCRSTEEKCIKANITYFCAADSDDKTLTEINNTVIAELHQSSEVIVLHHFVKDLNDLLARTGYPPIHFSNISAALEETQKPEERPRSKSTKTSRSTAGNTKESR